MLTYYHESVILQKTRLKGLILIIKSTYQGWYHSLTCFRLRKKSGESIDLYHRCPKPGTQGTRTTKTQGKRAKHWDFDMSNPPRVNLIPTHLWLQTGKVVVFTVTGMFGLVWNIRHNLANNLLTCTVSVLKRKNNHRDSRTCLLYYHSKFVWTR